MAELYRDLVTCRQRNFTLGYIEKLKTDTAEPNPTALSPDRVLWNAARAAAKLVS